MFSPSTGNEKMTDGDKYTHFDAWKNVRRDDHFTSMRPKGAHTFLIGRPFNRLLRRR